MQITDWVELMSRRGDVCTSYMRKLGAIETKEDLFRVLCDANGGAWLFDLHAKGPWYPMPVWEFTEEFKAYINGGRVMAYPQGYSSKFYCRYEGDIEILADTTLLYMLECRASVLVPANAFPSIILSKGSRASIAMLPGSRLNIETYGDAEYSVSGDMTRVRITKH